MAPTVATLLGSPFWQSGRTASAPSSATASWLGPVSQAPWAVALPAHSCGGIRPINSGTDEAARIGDDTNPVCASIPRYNLRRIHRLAPPCVRTCHATSRLLPVLSISRWRRTLPPMEDHHGPHLLAAGRNAETGTDPSRLASRGGSRRSRAPAGAPWQGRRRAPRTRGARDWLTRLENHFKSYTWIGVAPLQPPGNQNPSISQPSARATVKISLSPRPHMFMQIR